MIKHRFKEHDNLFTHGSTFNLKQTATAYTSALVDVTGFTEMLISLKIVQVGAATVGEVKISLQLFDDTDGLTTMSEVLDICTAISTAQGVGTKYSTVSIGPCLPDPSGINSGTMVSGAGAKLQGARKVKVIITPTTASDAATTCVGTLNLGLTF